jgi:hypothetical protein
MVAMAVTTTDQVTDTANTRIAVDMDTEVAVTAGNMAEDMAGITGVTNDITGMATTRR